MGEDKIEQKVTISDQASTGDITLIGKIVYIAKHPAEWQDVIWRFLSRHRGFLLAWLVLEVALGLIYLQYRNLHRIHVLLWALAAVLLLASAWGWYSFFGGNRANARLVLASLMSIALAGVMGWQSWWVAFPERFDPQVFGIAVAELGTGSDFRSTSLSREISGQVYEHLCLAIRSQFMSGNWNDPCKNLSEASQHVPIEVRMIGIIPNSRTARTYGERIGADVVIWGQLLSSEQGGVTIRFQVLETLDKAVNPEFPLILPVTNRYTEVFVEEIDLENNPAGVKEVVSEQSTIISAFTLGLASYLNMDIPQSVIEFEKAARTIEQSSRLEAPSPGKSLLYFYLGRSNNALGRLEEGQAWLNRARAANPAEPAVPLSLALGYGSLGENQLRDEHLSIAHELINEWLETHPDDITALFDRGIIHQILKQYREAIFDFERVIELDPDFFVAYISLGQAATEASDFERAERALREAIALAERSGSNPAWAHLNLARSYEKASQPERARAEFQEAIGRAPRVDWMYYYYARFLKDRGENEAALEAYTSMIEVSWDKGWAHGILAGFHKDQERLDKALENYLKAVSAKPSDALLRTNLAETYFELGEVENAIREFENAISISDDLYYPYASYGGILFQLGNFERAEQIYQQSLRLRPDDYKILFNLGRTHENLKQPERASEIYRDILSAGDQVPEVVINAARERLEYLEAVGF